MTRTELKVKLAEECLPRDGSFEVVKDYKGVPTWNSSPDYELAEKIVNFLISKGVPLEE